MAGVGGLALLGRVVCGDSGCDDQGDGPAVGDGCTGVGGVANDLDGVGAGCGVGGVFAAATGDGGEECSSGGEEEQQARRARHAAAEEEDGREEGGGDGAYDLVGRFVVGQGAGFDREGEGGGGAGGEGDGRLGEAAGRDGGQVGADEVDRAGEVVDGKCIDVNRKRTDNERRWPGFVAGFANLWGAWASKKGRRVSAGGLA